MLTNHASVIVPTSTDVQGQLGSPEKSPCKRFKSRRLSRVYHSIRNHVTNYASPADSDDTTRAVFQGTGVSLVPAEGDDLFDEVAQMEACFQEIWGDMDFRTLSELEMTQMQRLQPATSVSNDWLVEMIKTYKRLVHALHLRDHLTPVAEQYNASSPGQITLRDGTDTEDSTSSKEPHSMYSISTSKKAPTESSSVASSMESGELSSIGKHKFTSFIYRVRTRYLYKNEDNASKWHRLSERLRSRRRYYAESRSTQELQESIQALREDFKTKEHVVSTRLRDRYALVFRRSRQRSEPNERTFRDRVEPMFTWRQDFKQGESRALSVFSLLGIRRVEDIPLESPLSSHIVMDPLTNSTIDVDV